MVLGCEGSWNRDIPSRCTPLILRSSFGPPDGRLMFGTDLPVWQANERVGLTKRYMEYVRAFRETGLEAASSAAFRNFVCAGERGREGINDGCRPGDENE